MVVNFLYPCVIQIDAHFQIVFTADIMYIGTCSLADFLNEIQNQYCPKAFYSLFWLYTADYYNVMKLNYINGKKKQV